MKNIDRIKKRKIERVINFIEELGWLLNSKSTVDLKEAPELLRFLLDDNTLSISEDFSSTNKNKDALVGILPNLFLDNDLFKTNFDLAEFSDSVLKIKIPRYEKRSRFEIIGLIVSEVPKLDDSELSILVCAIRNLVGNKEKLKKVKDEKRKADFSWNQTIQKLNNL